MIIDAHSHIRVDEKYEKNLAEYILSMKRCNISKAIVSIDPFVKEFKCNKDFFHYVSINDIENNLRTYCHSCHSSNVYYEDPFQKYNKIIASINISNIFPFLMLPVVNNKIKDEINNFKDYIFGLKLYTGLSEKTLNDLTDFNYDLPLLIHTGTQKNQNPKYMLEFLKKYKGYIILAHYARFCPEVTDLIKNSENVFVDTSPTMYLYKNYVESQRKGGLFSKEDLISPESFYYKAFELYGVDKIIFGTDYPFSDRKKEIELLNSLRISEDEYDKITFKNIKKVMGGKL